MNRKIVGFSLVWLLLLAYLIATALLWDTSVRQYEGRFVSAATNADISARRGKLFLDNDACYWITYAREMARTGQWRIHHTYADNPPFGRPVHWSQSVSWLLLFTGHVRRMFTGEDISIAIENGSIWVGSALMAILTLASGILLFKRLGFIPAILWMLNLGTISSLQWSFHPLRPDHHGLQISFVLGSLLCLMLGGLGWIDLHAEAKKRGLQWFRPVELPSHKTARHYFIASGILGGFGFWTGATVQLFGVGLVTVGAMLLIFFMPPRVADSNPSIAYRPTLWRIWAITGAVTSLAFYLLEYAPHFPGMRLEVNHPLYAVSWLCAGECMTLLSTLKTRRSVITSRNMAGILLAGLGTVILPLLLWFGPASWHTMREPHMQRMHAHILEFLPFANTYDMRLVKTLLMNFGFLPVFLLAAPLLTGSKKSTLYEWALLWMAFLPAFSYAVLTLMQNRWMFFFSFASLLLAMVTLAILARHQAVAGRPSFFVWLITAALLAQPFLFVHGQARDIANMHNPNAIIDDLAKSILQRQLAARMGALNTNGNFRIMCEPDMAARMFYYGGIPCVTSYYWENLDGLLTATEFMTDPSNDKAAAIVRERGITHVILPRTGAIAHMFYFFKTGHLSEIGARDSMAGRLLTKSKSLPPWIVRNLPFMKEVEPGYVYNRRPVFNTLEIYAIRPEYLNSADGNGK